MFDHKQLMQIEAQLDALSDDIKSLRKDLATISKRKAAPAGFALPVDAQDKLDEIHRLFSRLKP